jgi:hypothetical protein
MPVRQRLEQLFREKGNINAERLREIRATIREEYPELSGLEAGTAIVDAWDRWPGATDAFLGPARRGPGYVSGIRTALTESGIEYNPLIAAPPVVADSLDTGFRSGLDYSTTGIAVDPQVETPTPTPAPIPALTPLERKQDAAGLAARHEEIKKKINDINRLYHRQELEDATTAAQETFVFEEGDPIGALVAGIGALDDQRAVGRVRFEPVVFDVGAAQAMLDYATTHVYETLVAAGYEDSQETWSEVSGYVLDNIFLGITIDPETQEVKRGERRNLETAEDSRGAFNAPWKDTAFTALSGYQNVFMYDPANFLPEHWIAEVIRQQEILETVPAGAGARLKAVTGARAEVAAGVTPDVWYEAYDEELVRFIEALVPKLTELMFTEASPGKEAQTFVRGGVAVLFDRKAGQESDALVDSGESTFGAYGHDPDEQARRERREQFEAAFGDGSPSAGDITKTIMDFWLDKYGIPRDLMNIIDPETGLKDKTLRDAVRHQSSEVRKWATAELVKMEQFDGITETERQAFMVDINEKMGQQFLDNVAADVRATRQAAQEAEAEVFRGNMKTESKRAAFIEEQIKRIVTEEGGTDRTYTNEQVGYLSDDIAKWAVYLDPIRFAGNQAAAEELFRGTIAPLILPALRAHYKQEWEADIAAVPALDTSTAAALAADALDKELLDAGISWGHLDDAVKSDLINFVLEHDGLPDAARPDVAGLLPGVEPQPRGSVLDEFLAMARPGIEAAQYLEALRNERPEAEDLAIIALDEALRSAGLVWGNLDLGSRNEIIEGIIRMQDAGATPQQITAWVNDRAGPVIGLARDEAALFGDRPQAVGQITAALADAGVVFSQLPPELQSQLIETVMAMGGDLFDPRIADVTRGAILESVVTQGRAGWDEIVAERELGVARAGLGESFRDALRARHPNLIRTEEQLAYFNDVVMTDFWRQYDTADYLGEVDTAGGIEEFIRTVVEGVDTDQFITPAVIGPTRLQQEEALQQLKVNEAIGYRQAQRAAVAESERLAGERADLEGVIPGLQMAAAGDEGFERFLYGELPGIRTDYDDELAARREVMAREVREQTTAWHKVGYEAAQQVEEFPIYPLDIGPPGGGPPAIPGAGVPPEERVGGYAQPPGLYAAIGAAAERREQADRPDWEEYVAGQIPGLRTRYTREQEEREALFAPPGSETRRIMDEQQAQVEENRLAREQYDREAAQERRQRTLTRATPGARVQRTRGRY